jgi:hypothetical protein
MDNWKKIAIRAAAFGAGFAVVAVVIVGGAVWWSNRPVKPKSWNKSAITATYDTLDTEGDANTFEFVYTLENNTDYDYRAADEGEIHLAANLKKFHSLSFDQGKMLKTDYPIYIPARSRVRFKIHVAYPYPIKQDLKAPNDEQHDYGTRLAQFADKDFGNLNGFALLDDKARYQVDMPNGWAERAKESLRVKANENIK